MPARAPRVTTASGCGSAAPHLTVQGTGEASATPDVLTAVFGFTTTAGSSAAALSENNAQVNQALLALTGNGVARRDVQTTGLSLQPQYAYPKGVPTLTGYQVTNTVTATLRDTTTAGAAIDAVVNASGNAAQINSLTFSFGDPARVRGRGPGRRGPPGRGARRRHGRRGGPEAGAGVLAHRRHPALRSSNQPKVLRPMRALRRHRPCPCSPAPRSNRTR